MSMGGCLLLLRFSMKRVSILDRDSFSPATCVSTPVVELVVVGGECSKYSDRAYQIGSRRGSQGDANDSSSEFNGSWWGCYLHSNAPPVEAVYATLRRQSTRFRCRSSASSPSTLHVPWARTSPYTEPRFQEPTWSCSVAAVYATLRR